MKILVQPYTQILSHTFRPILVAKELRRRGHDVVFAGGSPKTKFIQKDGFDVLPMYEPDSEVIWSNIRNGKIKFVPDTELDSMIQSDIELYRAVKPDLVLTDFRFSAPISTHIVGIKHAAIVNASSSEYRAFPFIPLFEWVPHWLVKRDARLWQYLDMLNLKIEMAVFDNVMGYFKRLSNKHGLAKMITATNCLTGKDITLLADIPEYFPTRNLPNNYHYIGPLVWKDGASAPKWWPVKKGAKPLIYITMGTTGLGDFFRRVIELCTTSDLLAIMTTGGQVKDIQTIENKVYVEDYIDGDLVMEACDLVVCHGGNGTINQALLHGKPIIGIPNTPDAAFNMRRVEALGVGEMISQKEFTDKPDILADTIRHILKTRSYYDCALRLKKTLEVCNAPKTAADILEKGNVI